MDMIAVVGIDVSKDRLDVHVVPSEEAFFVANDAAGVEKLAGRLTELSAALVALEATGGKTDDKEALIKALRAVSLSDSPRGPFHFDHFGNVVGNVYIRRLVKQDGKLAQNTIKTYPDVSQFWTYDEKWFLSQPVYSRDYPPPKS